MRNIGVPFAHSIISYKAIIKGLEKLTVNDNKIHADLNNDWGILAEAIQTILRREGVKKPYELLKKVTRNNKTINEVAITQFINDLKVSNRVKKELKKLTPFNYTGQS